MRTVIVDDEPLARSQLQRLCRAHSDLEVVAEADSGAAAIETIRGHRPDLVLLDVELRDMTGFDVLAALNARNAPLTIMVTAYPQHAAEAFNTQAIDYVTKPVAPQRFGAAIERARARQTSSSIAGLSRQIAEEVRASLRALSLAGPVQLVGEKARCLHFIEPDTVDYIESDGNYVTIHVGEERYITRNSVKNLARLLVPVGFVRIERSLLLNLRRVAFAEKVGRSTFAFTLRTGRRLASGRTYRRHILRSIRLTQFASAGELPASAADGTAVPIAPLGSDGGRANTF